MPSCAAVNCTNRQFKGCGWTFHLFPFGRPCLLKQWMVNIRRDKWSPSKKSVLCSDHFTPECFDKSGQTTRLKADAAPTVFSFPAHLQKSRQKTRKAPCQRRIDQTNEQLQNGNPDQATTTTTSEDSKLPHDEHPYAIHESPRGIKRKLNDAIDHIDSLKKKLKSTQQTSRRLKRKVRSLHKVVDMLKEKRSKSITSGTEYLYTF